MILWVPARRHPLLLGIKQRPRIEQCAKSGRNFTTAGQWMTVERIKLSSSGLSWYVFFVWISFCEVWFLDHCYCAGANRVRAKRSFVWKPVTTSTSYTKHTFDSKWGRPAISKPLPEVGYFIIALHSRLYISSSIYLMYFNPQESCNKLCPRFSRPPFVVLRGLYSICEFTLRRTYLFAVGRTASIMHHAFSIMTQSDAYPRKTRLRRLSYKHDVVVLSS